MAKEAADKDTFYFSHDMNARNDEKLVKVRVKHGWAGYGLFWALVERLRESGDLCSKAEYDVIAYELRTEESIVKSLIEDFELFEFSQCKNFYFSRRLKKSMKKLEEKRWKNTLNGIIGSLVKNGTVTRENVAKMMDWEIVNLHNVSHPSAMLQLPLGHPEASKVKKSKSKESKVKIKLLSPPAGDGAQITLPLFAQMEKEYTEMEKTKELIKKFIEANKPPFLMPYIDYWNLFAERYQLPKVKDLTKFRKQKIAVRCNEGAFNFPKIISEASISPFLTDGTNGKWFCFDWVIKNEQNYVKILDGNYKKSDTKLAAGNPDALSAAINNNSQKK